VTLYLTRHGETAENAAGLVQGRGLDPDLNAVGRAQAVALAQRLASVPLAAVVTSTQKRSQQTAEPTLALHPGATLIVRAGIDEMDWGVHEGRGFTPTSRDEATTASYDRLNEQWAAGATDVRVEGGESPDEVWARVRPVLVELGEAYPEADVLVVSHRRLLRILLAGALPGGDLSRMHDYPHGNAALSVLDVPGGILGPDVRLVHLADTAHLAAL
jgi:probable phosphoglycerate mutase